MGAGLVQDTAGFHLVVQLKMVQRGAVLVEGCRSLRPKCLRYDTYWVQGRSATFLPLVLFEDPDVLETRVAHLPRAHLLNTAAWIRALADEGIISDGRQILDQINAQRKSPMIPTERPEAREG